MPNALPRHGTRRCCRRSRRLAEWPNSSNKSCVLQARGGGASCKNCLFSHRAAACPPAIHVKANSFHIGWLGVLDHVTAMNSHVRREDISPPSRTRRCREGLSSWALLQVLNSKKNRRRPLDNEMSERPEADFHKSTLGKGDLLKGSRWGQGDIILKLSFLVSFWALWEPRQTDAQMELWKRRVPGKVSLNQRVWRFGGEALEHQKCLGRCVSVHCSGSFEASVWAFEAFSQSA